ncbi:hypothetical protein BN7_2834 [Wickerhamomyces ciferrii]|uniref:SAGA-associated factor 11 n=1 Tax=Wickerhamomyces ciferrii (strain ATCC 14091 / BCRC 22168 / CBS 111 / JCM 3599 / NBRC 0793 / NRRL Y-1031 F-60-10) TaxID=1206466 RepID=K0KK49_WICCF|nr:uncharacterized protein BN7_2834 [Wickerhamomyces ciferrii]CCH43286.1 hypothetical protein BN7_2834 [Wickerhamomyces ciferrii]
MSTQEEELTLYSVSASIYKDIMETITHELFVDAIMREQITRAKYGRLETGNTPTPVETPTALNNLNGNGLLSASTSQNNTGNNSRNPSPNPELLTRMAYYSVMGRDIFGNEKQSDSSRYFTCDNCSRKIAGNRFAAHIDRCLGGRSRK